MRVTFRRGLWGRDAVGRVADPGQRPAAVLLGAGAPVVGAADAGVARAWSIQTLHFLDGQPHGRPRLQGDLLYGLLQPTARPGGVAVAGHGLRTLAAPPQPGGVVEHGRWLAHVVVQVQRAAVTASQVEFSGWRVSVKGRGLVERGGGVSGQRVGGGAC